MPGDVGHFLAAQHHVVGKLEIGVLRAGDGDFFILAHQAQVAVQGKGQVRPGAILPIPHNLIALHGGEHIVGTANLRNLRASRVLVLGADGSVDIIVNIVDRTVAEGDSQLTVAIGNTAAPAAVIDLGSRGVRVIGIILMILVEERRYRSIANLAARVSIGCAVAIVEGIAGYRNIDVVSGDIMGFVNFLVLGIQRAVGKIPVAVLIPIGVSGQTGVALEAGSGVINGIRIEIGFIGNAHLIRGAVTGMCDGEIHILPMAQVSGVVDHIQIILLCRIHLSVVDIHIVAGNAHLVGKAAAQGRHRVVHLGGPMAHSVQLIVAVAGDHIAVGAIIVGNRVSG